MHLTDSQAHEAALAMYRIKSAVVNDQSFFGEELERAVSRHIDGVSNVALNRWKNGNDRADFMVVGCIIDFLANRKLRHRKLLLESSMRVYHFLKPNSLMLGGITDGTIDGPISI
jgi:hypothetical protein